MAYLFEMKPATFEKRVTSMISITYDFLYIRFVPFYAEKCDMGRLLADKIHSKPLKCVDMSLTEPFSRVTFRRFSRGSEEVFSGKHKLYGYKVEASVISNALAISVRNHHPCSVSDIEIMRDMSHFHDDTLEETAKESAITDIGRGSEMYPNRWRVLLDKLYVGIEFGSTGNHSEEEAPPWCSDGSRRAGNAAPATDRIIVENVFGRQGTLWAIVANNYRWAEGGYDRIFRMTLALSNIHIKWHPLRNADGKTCERYLKRLHEVADTYVTKRKRAQAA